jgi:hypothetical protein
MIVPNNTRYGRGKMSRRVCVVELQDIVRRLRLGQSVKAIHRQTRVIRPFFEQFEIWLLVKDG